MQIKFENPENHVINKVQYFDQTSIKLRKVNYHLKMFSASFLRKTDLQR